MLTTTCLMAGKPYPAEGTTETAVTALLIPKKDFDHALATSVNFRRVVFDHLSHRFSDIIARIESVKFRGLDTRLATALLSNTDELQRVRLTHQELANEIGTSREVVSRHLKGLEQQGLVTLSRGCVLLLKPGALARLAESAGVSNG